MVFERRDVEVVDFNTAYRVRLPAVARCRVMLGREKMPRRKKRKKEGRKIWKSRIR